MKLDCVKYVDYIKLRIKKEKIYPSIVIISLSKDEASSIYLKNKEKLFKELNFKYNIIKYDKKVKEIDIINKINELNIDNNINGIIVQLPIYKHLNKDAIINSIEPIKDIDGLTIINKGLLFNKTPMFIPCTAKGIMDLINYYKISIKGKNVVILGRSELVGKPLYELMLQKDATVTICHSKTKDITKYTKEADILISAIGKSKYIKIDMIKDNSILIDVGINKLNNKICGDIDYDNVINKCKLITKVPSGIGIVTTITLASNLIKAYKIQHKRKEKEYV
ncbi:MAG: bifunctional 5,10-methylenetetrahydrofolate dehydrogenase/5,10-methenyltetrahydrofolate cyclohydrolase [Bacilli bacterium]|nr:bifunctional 5,10-methylenetetrahydrofolate dehydrogenase/5,10-methenyltetrahydrofolate cyclohydrolase [Bacilli bacterium]